MQDEDSTSTSKASILKSVAAITKKRSSVRAKPSAAKQEHVATPAKPPRQSIHSVYESLSQASFSKSPDPMQSAVRSCAGSWVFESRQSSFVSR